jgi:tRNA (adenine57-N1/adenine58-N1)-methyltransferase
MYEALIRNYDPITLVKPAPTVQEAVDHLKNVEQKKESRRQAQISRSTAAKAPKTAPKALAASTSEAPALDEDAQLDNLPEMQADPTADVEMAPVKTEEAPPQEVPTKQEPAKKQERTPRPPKAKRPGERRTMGKGKRKRDDADASEGEEADFEPTLLARPLHNLRGHTSYLTFATLLPKSDPVEPVRVNGTLSKEGTMSKEDMDKLVEGVSFSNESL